MDIEQQLTNLLSPTESARLKGMSLNKFKYHIVKPGAPRPTFVGEHGHPFYDKNDVAKWQPTKRKTK